MAISTTWLKQKVSVGDTVKITQKIVEGDKERSQDFTGLVIAIKNSTSGRSVTVRKIGHANIGVERIWPTSSPWITKLEVIRYGQVKRGKLYFTRKKIGKTALRVKGKKLAKTNK